MSLVTPDQVIAALRLDGQNASDIALKIVQAQAIVLDFIQPKPDPAWTPESVPGQVTAAIIIGVRCLLDDTEESLAMLSGLSGATQPDSRNPIAALLWRLRDPSLA